jgi:hypothetical protein
MHGCAPAPHTSLQPRAFHTARNVSITKSIAAATCMPHRGEVRILEPAAQGNGSRWIAANPGPSCKRRKGDAEGEDFPHFPRPHPSPPLFVWVESMNETNSRVWGLGGTMVSWRWRWRCCIALLATAPLIVTPAGDIKGSGGRLRSRPWPSLRTGIRGGEDWGGVLRLRGGKTDAGRTWSSRGRWGQKMDMEAAAGGDPATHHEVMP